MTTLKCTIIAPLALAAMTALAHRASAQDQNGELAYTNIGSYAIAFPIGDTHRFIRNTSWFGASWEGQWRAGPTTTAGATVAINDFYNHTGGTTNFAFGSAT